MWSLVFGADGSWAGIDPSGSKSRGSFSSVAANEIKVDEPGCVSIYGWALNANAVTFTVVVAGCGRDAFFTDGPWTRS